LGTFEYLNAKVMVALAQRRHLIATVMATEFVTLTQAGNCNSTDKCMGTEVIFANYCCD